MDYIAMVSARDENRLKKKLLENYLKGHDKSDTDFKQRYNGNPVFKQTTFQSRFFINIYTMV